MRLASVILLVVMGCVGGPLPCGEARQQIPTYPSRELEASEVYEALVDNSELLLIARVLRVDTTVTSDRVRLSVLEPVAWLRGGLDGDEIEVFRREGVPAERPYESSSWRAVVGVDTMGVLVSLTRLDGNWHVSRTGVPGMEPGFRVLQQREFRALRDSLVDAMARGKIGFLVDRSTVIIVVADTTALERNGPRSGDATIRWARLLKGESTRPSIRLRPWVAYRALPGEVLFLRSIGDDVYEPIPFHRDRPPTFDIESPGGMRPIEIESAVRASVARGETRKSWR